MCRSLKFGDRAAPASEVRAVKVKGITGDGGEGEERGDCSTEEGIPKSCEERFDILLESKR